MRNMRNERCFKFWHNPRCSYMRSCCHLVPMACHKLTYKLKHSCIGAKHGTPGQPAFRFFRSRVLCFAIRGLLCSYAPTLRCSCRLEKNGAVRDWLGGAVRNWLLAFAQLRIGKPHVMNIVVAKTDRVICRHFVVRRHVRGDCPIRLAGRGERN